MRRVTLCRLVWVVPFALLMASCDSQTTPTTPTTPTPTTVAVTDVFKGTVFQSGSAFHTFTTEAGTVTTTLKEIVPATLAGIGVDVGTWDGTTCTIVLTNTAATTGSALVGTASTSISLCVRVYDVGNISEEEPATYTVEVAHQTKPS